MRKLLLATTALLALSGAAQADVTLGGTTWFTSGATQLQLVNQAPAGNQPQNAPCLICGDNQPQQPAGFGYNDWGNTGGVNTINMFSTATVGGSLNDNVIGTGYAVGGFLLPFLAARNDGTSFSVGIDLNQANGAGPQVLESFYFLNLTQHTVLASYNPNPGTPLNAVNNGTGFPDYFLTGFDLQRGDIALGDQVIFFARMTNLSDGPDSFFLVPNAVAAVPEASTWAMMIVGFLGVGLLGARKKLGAVRLA